MNFVLDASVTMCWLLLDGKSVERTYALKVLDAMKDRETSALVPVTWGLEVSNVIAKAETKGLINEAQSEAFLEMLAAVDIAADSATFSKALSDTLQIARRYRLSVYDASYLELSMREGVPLATLDQDLGKAANKAGVKRF
ncbi:MAG: type II toxin-antitoxin system VapC family toxin [Novosphingobium sp.]|nr:type II toxin-antitoxin system VapC family toxin [Novosphingobium sp.]